MRNTVADIRTYSSSLRKAFRLLALFSRERPEWGVTEMSEKLGTAKSTVSRIARTLEAEGFLRRTPNSERYRLGLRLWELGTQVVGDKSDFARLARPHLERIVSEINESAQAVMIDGTDAVYVEKCDAPRSIRTYSTIGQRFPLHCTGTGRALLAFQSDLFIASLLEKKLKGFTPKTVTDAVALKRELQRIRARGFSVSKGEWREDIGGIAAPVFDRYGEVAGALGVTAPLVRFPKDIQSPVAAAVIRGAAELSRELGYLPTEARGEGRRAGR